MGCVESKRKSFNGSKYRDRSFNQQPRIFDPKDRSMTEAKSYGKLEPLPRKVKDSINIIDKSRVEEIRQSRKVQTPKSQNLTLKLNQIMQESIIRKESLPNTLKLDSVSMHASQRLEKRKTPAPPSLHQSKASSRMNFEYIERDQVANHIYYHSSKGALKPYIDSASTGNLMQQYLVGEKLTTQQTESKEPVDLKKLQNIDINIKLEPPKNYILNQESTEASPMQLMQPPRFYTAKKYTQAEYVVDSTNQKSIIHTRTMQTKDILVENINLTRELMPAVSNRKPHPTRYIDHQDYFSNLEVKPIKN